MAATAEDVIDAVVDPAWIGIAAELIPAFPKGLDPRERMNLLFAALHARLGTTDFIAFAAVHSRIAALGHMDRSIRLGDLHPAGDNPDADALRHAVATAPLHVEGEHLVFDPVGFQRCFAAARQAGTRRAGRESERGHPKASGMAAAEKARVAEKLDERVQALLLAGLDDVALMGAMSDHMPDFKRLLDAAEPGELDKLARRFPAFGHYAAVLTAVAAAIRDGAIEVPK